MSPVPASAPGSSHNGDGIYTDGSASPNPGPGGWGALLVSRGQIVSHSSGQEAHTTNNRMELAAIAAGLHLVPAGTLTVVTLHSDSSYAVQALTTWVHGWRRNGWRTRNGPVKNQDLLEAALDALQARPGVTLKWVKAHVGDRWNEAADQLANQARSRA
jgi:ribonuclease HI